jgi:hypothetical protein
MLSRRGRDHTAYPINMAVPSGFTLHISRFTGYIATLHACPVGAGEGRRERQKRAFLVKKKFLQNPVVTTIDMTARG